MSSNAFLAFMERITGSFWADRAHKKKKQHKDTLQNIFSTKIAPISDKLNIQGTLPAYISLPLCLHDDDNIILINESYISYTGITSYYETIFFKKIEYS